MANKSGPKERRSGFQIMRQLIALLKPLRLEMAVAITAGVLGFLLSFGLGLLGVFAVLKAMGLDLQGIPLGQFSTQTYLILLVVAAVLRGVFHYIEQYFNHLIAFKVLAVMRHKVFSSMQKLAPAKIESKDPGQLISLIMGDIELLEVFYAHTVSPIAIASLTTLILLVFNVQIHPCVALLALLAQLTIGFIYPQLAAKAGNKISVEIREQIGDLNGVFLDHLKGLREVVQYGKAEQTLAKLESVTEQLLNRQDQLNQQMYRLSAFLDTAIIFFSVAQLALCIVLFHLALITMPAVILASFLTLSSFSPYINLANLGNTLTRTFACGERVLSLLEEEPEIEENITGKEAIVGDLKLDEVSFKYTEDAPWVLDKQNLQLKKGEILGLMGGSGCGKSTLLKLCLRFWNPNQGQITLAETDLAELKTKSLYDRVNYMTQTTQLFSGTIRENLLIANPEASEEQLWFALKQAALADYVASLEAGLEALIGEEGVNFSGGERQRLGLARCFLADKSLFFLDEPSSNLDSINEALILKAIVEGRQDKSIILVSHRASTLAICDRVIKMEAVS